MCTTGIINRVNLYLQNKPYFKFNGRDFITVKSGSNKFNMAKTLAEKLNKAINNGKELGDVFYPETGSDAIGVGIRPTAEQLDYLNASDKEEARLAKERLENSRFLKEFENRKQEELKRGLSFNKSDDDIFFQKSNSEKDIAASEKTLRELSARMSDRIGIRYTFISDRTQMFKGRFKDNVATINLAYTTLDTPIHEILGHPIIRAIKNQVKEKQFYLSDGTPSKFGTYDKEGKLVLRKIDKIGEKSDSNWESTQLYQNLLKELEYGKGKEVLDRIKRDYTVKAQAPEKNNDYEYEDYIYTQRGAVFSRYNKITGIFEETTEDKHLEALNYYYDNNKIKYTLEEQQEEAIVELLGLYTADRLDKVKEGKLISLLKRLLKEIKSFIKELLKQKVVDIDKLPDNMTLGDIADLLAYSNSKLILPGNEVVYTTPDNQKFKTYEEASKHISDLAKSVEDVDLDNIKLEKKSVIGQIDPITNKRIKNAKFIKGTEPEWSPDDNVAFPGTPDIFELQFDDGSNNTVYDEDLFRNYGKEVNQFYRQIRPLKNTIDNFIEKNKRYEQSKEIIEEWKKVNNIQYNPEEIYSRGQEFVSIVGAYSDFDVNLMMQNLLQHIEDNQKAGGEFTISAFTKPIDKQIGHLEGGGGKIKFKIYPQSKDIKWAANIDAYSGSVWDASEKVNKDKKSELLGVSYSKYPSLSNVNSVQPNLASIVDNLSHYHNELGISLTGNNFRLEYDEDIPYSTKKIINTINSILDQKYGKLVKPEIKQKEFSTKYITKEESAYGDFKTKIFDTEKEALDYKKSMEQYEDVFVRISKQVGIQPTQTNETLKESIESIKNNQLQRKTAYSVKEGNILRSEGWESVGFNYELGEEYFEKPNTKEYTSQALINTKIAKLKEVAKKYPRSLIRSEVKMIGQKSQAYTTYLDEWQKIPSESDDDIYYQMNVKMDNSSIKELDSYLLNFLKGFNVKFKELKSRLGVDALGATDVLNKLIWYVKNRNEETLPEESAHMLVALMGENHPDIKELLTNIQNWSGYEGVKNQYLSLYNNDESKVKIEAVGKLIAKALVKNYKAAGLDNNKLQKLLDNILTFIEKILDGIDFASIFMYNEYIADHIAINVLSGNKDYIYKIKNLNPNLNALKEIENNPNAKKIINTFSSDNVKMTGSLAIAGTENIRRPEGQGIHDIDFKVKNFDIFNKEVLPKIPENAVPAHYGWHKKSYSTFAYLIPSQGYKIQVLERKDDFSNGWITNYKLYNEKNEQIEITQQNVTSVNFFVYKEEAYQKDFDFSSKFIPASLVYEGKMSLGGKSNPYFFNRDKDQEDYVLRNPKSFIPFDNHIYYQYNETIEIDDLPTIELTC